jgi:hypothetical protein
MMALSIKMELKSHYLAIVPAYNVAPAIDRHGTQAPLLMRNWQDARLRR